MLLDDLNSLLSTPIFPDIQSNVDYSITSSCYDPSPKGEPCYQCDSCQLRRKGFLEAGISDPLIKKFKGSPNQILPA